MDMAGGLLPCQFHKALLNVFYSIARFSSNYFLNSSDKSRIQEFSPLYCAKYVAIKYYSWQKLHGSLRDLHKIWGSRKQ